MVRDRILGPIDSIEDGALVFAASSIVNEITAPDYGGGVVVRTVRTDSHQYTLRGDRVSGPAGLQPVVLVVAEPAGDGPATPSLKELRVHSRFRLTRKEERVAQLLAARKSNEEIAAELCISRHTARHHTQSVLSKLGVRSRKEVVSVSRED